MFKYVLCACAIINVCSVELANAAEVIRDWAPAVDRRIKLLASASVEDRLAASDWLMNSEPDALPVIEAAVSKIAAGDPVAARLNAVLEKLRPLAKTRAQDEAVNEAELQWNEKTALDAYERFGAKNPAWDGEARKAIKQYVSRNAADRAAASVTLEKLVNELHCRDALIRYMRARRLQLAGYNDQTGDEVMNSYQAACTAFLKSNYPAFRKCYAYCQYARFLRNIRCTTTVDSLTRFNDSVAKEIVTLWPQAITEPGLPRGLALDLSKLALDEQVAAGKDRGQILDTMLPIFEKAFTKDSTAFVFAGNAYIDFAWDARGGGYARLSRLKVGS